MAMVAVMVMVAVMARAAVLMARFISWRNEMVIIEPLLHEEGC